MGMDMYLSARNYIGGWPHSKQEERDQCHAVLKSVGFQPDIMTNGSPHIYVEICVAYWRKANAIHGWFVRECQEGVDECQNTYVEREKLETLLSTCKEAKADKDKGPAKLPPVGGFFFGSTVVDEWYWQDIDETISQLESILGNEKLKDWSFQYLSSW